jgi:hypothetical protein
MTLDLSPLLARAFLRADASRTNEAIAEAREGFAQAGERAFSWEIVVPAEPDRPWLEELLLRRLVYHCESSKAPLPACAGVFVSFFVGTELFCVPASEVVAFGAALLGQSPAALVARFGTGESRVAAPLALPGPDT